MVGFFLYGYSWDKINEWTDGRTFLVGGVLDVHVGRLEVVEG
jgi:hypothetical protein